MAACLLSTQMMENLGLDVVLKSYSDLSGLPKQMSELKNHMLVLVFENNSWRFEKSALSIIFH